MNESRAIEIRENVLGAIQKLLDGGGRWRDLYPSCDGNGTPPERRLLQRLVADGLVTKIETANVTQTRYVAADRTALQRCLDSDDELTWLIWPSTRPAGTVNGPAAVGAAPPFVASPGATVLGEPESEEGAEAEAVQGMLLKLMAANIEAIAALNAKVDRIDKRLEELWQLWKT